ncbi:hypothetical protein PPO43_08340 [Saprospira sp. CCB-QB6]|uniref:hypothetical protein n=1 Tax=Saprospira sp. CCB-QB6 TaxID=3023936 RepID=UPI00234B0AE3|nr:hypothetical protein [Saprospira sp. CCB-QB6]WCL79986.1 hypothetical protein PPO43_08340 [Saprospira sp. CCB-QB6]
MKLIKLLYCYLLLVSGPLAAQLSDSLGFLRLEQLLDQRLAKASYSLEEQQLWDSLCSCHFAAGDSLFMADLHPHPDQIIRLSPEAQAQLEAVAPIQLRSPAVGSSFLPITDKREGHISQAKGLAWGKAYRLVHFSSFYHHQGPNPNMHKFKSCSFKLYKGKTASLRRFWKAAKARREDWEDLVLKVYENGVVVISVSHHYIGNSSWMSRDNLFLLPLF